MTNSDKRGNPRFKPVQPGRLEKTSQTLSNATQRDENHLKKIQSRQSGVQGSWAESSPRTNHQEYPARSIEFEEGVLGAILLEKAIPSEIIRILTPLNFYNSNTSVIYSTMLELQREGKPVDILTVTDMLKERGELEQVGGSYYVSGLPEQCSSSSHAPYYASRIVEYANRRRLQNLGIRLSRGEMDVLNELKEFYLHPYLREPNTERKVRSMKDLLNDSILEPPQLIGKGLLPTQSILLIAGPPKIGKSLLSLNLAFCLTSGRDWFNYNIENPVSVLVIQAEVVSYQQRKRLKVMKANCEFPVNEDSLFISDPFRCDITTEEGFRSIVEPIAKHEPSVVIIDPLVDYHCADENSNNEMALVMQKFRDLTFSGLSVILIHHTRKSLDNSSAANARGASVIPGAVDSIMELREHQGKVKAKFDLRYGHAPDGMNLVLNHGTFWFELVPENKTHTQNYFVQQLKNAGAKGIFRTDLEKDTATRFQMSERAASNHIRQCIQKGTIDTDHKQRNMTLFLAGYEGRNDAR